MLNTGNISNAQKRKLISAGYLGTKWNLIRSGGNIPLLKILSPTKEKLIILNGTDVYISNNGGGSWTQTGLNAIANSAISGTKIVDIDCSSDGNVILAAGGRVSKLSGQLVQFTYDGYFYISTNGGSSWSTITAYGSGAWTKALVSSDGQTMYLAQEHNSFNDPATPNSGVWRSTNGGSSWGKLTQTIGGSYVDSGSGWKMNMSADGSILYVMFSSSGPAFNLYKSTNSGNNWSNISPTIANPSYSGYDPIAIKCSDNGSFVFLAEREDFIVSSNGGSSWSSKNLWTNAFNGASSIDIDCSSDGKIAYVAGYDYPDTTRDIFVSLDYGQTWARKRDTSLVSSPPYYADKISCTEDGLIAFVSDPTGDLYKVSYVK